jgi:4-amino-4-deoxy-L-arabinose transferase-like glycosyltransferase
MRSVEGDFPLPESAPRTAPADYSARRRAVGLLTAAFLLTLLTRLLFILLPQVPIETKAVTSIGDSREYIALARNLVASHTFTRDTVPPFRPELFRTPGYPLSLALPLIVHRPSFIVLALALQLLLALLTVWLTWKLGTELELGPTMAAFAALLVGLSPNLAFLSSKLISESLFTPLLLVCLLLLNRYRQNGRVLDLIGTGVCSGLLVIIRPIATFFPLLIALYIFVLGIRRNWKLGTGNSILVLACASIVVAPWVIRNGRETGRYIVSTASEHNIYLYDAATVVASQKGITIPQARDLMMAEAEAKFGRVDTTDEAGMWQKLAAVARPHLLRKPSLAVPVWLFGVAADFLNPISVGPLLIHSGASPAAGSANLLQSSLALLVKGKVTEAFSTAWRVRVGGAPHFILVVLACAVLFNLILIWFGFAGLFLHRTRGLFWLLLPILYFTLLTGTVGDARFRAPIEPLLCLFAAVALIRPPRPAAARPRVLPSHGTSDQDNGNCSIGLATPGTTHCE